MSRLGLVSLFVAALVWAPNAWATDETPALRFELVFHIPTLDGVPVADEAWRVEALAMADAHFAAAGIAFDVVEVHTIGEEHAILRTIRARRILRRYLRPRRINVFVVEDILDPHPSATTRRAAGWQGREPTGRLGGAHIEVEGRVPETYLLINRQSSRLTLTHELGHFFGVAHSRVPENIMSYGRERERFDEQQLATFRRRARRYARERSVRVTRD